MDVEKATGQVDQASPPQSQENIKTETTYEREVECQECGVKGKQVWKKGGVETYLFLGKNRTMHIEDEVVRADFIPPFCNPCRKKIHEKKNWEAVQSLKMVRHAQFVEIIGGEKPAIEFTFGRYAPKTPSQAAAIAVCQSMNPEKDNLLLVGPAGVGKTHLACAVLNQGFTDNELSVRRFRVTELFRLLRYERTAEKEEALIKALVKIDLLLIEDLGAHKETSWNSAVLWEILDRRIESNKNGLIVTSNLGRGKMAEQMGDRIPSRLSGICKMVLIDGPDMRVEKA